MSRIPGMLRHCYTHGVKSLTTFHSSNVLAYSITPTLPLPFRFRSTTLRLQLPNLTYLSSMKFFREMRKTTTFKFLANVIFTVRTWARRTIWGDRVCF